METESDEWSAVVTTSSGVSFIVARTYGEWLDDLRENAAFLSDCGDLWLADVIRSAKYAAAVRPVWN